MRRLLGEGFFFFAPTSLVGFDLFYEGQKMKTSLPNAVGCRRMCDMAFCQYLN